MVPGDKNRVNRYKGKYMRIPLNIMKHFLTVRVTKRHHKLPREAVESVFGDIHKLS